MCNHFADISQEIPTLSTTRDKEKRRKKNDSAFEKRAFNAAKKPAFDRVHACNDSPPSSPSTTTTVIRHEG